MLELEPIEARVSTRTPRMDPPSAAAPSQVRFAPIAAFLKGPIFSRTRDIVAANMTDLLDRAEDPARMIRMIILEMEETLVEVRAAAARSIADATEMRRALVRLEDLQTNWTAKAELALSKDREDLAKQALIGRASCRERVCNDV